MISLGANRAVLCPAMQGLLPPLDAPHHVRKHEWSEFREGDISSGAPAIDSKFLAHNLN
jgi:hypothetical protein